MKSFKLIISVTILVILFYEKSWAEWTKIDVGSGGSYIWEVAVGNGRNDGVDRVYGTAGDGHIYEFSWGGSSWTKVDLSSGVLDMYGVAVGNGRNDGVDRVYGANGDGYIYEFSWTGSSWTKINLPPSVFCMFGVAVGNGRNDGVDRVYGASINEHIYEFSWSGSSWTHVDVGSGGSTMLGVIVGDGRDDEYSRVYGTTNNEFSWTGSSWTKIDFDEGNVAEVRIGTGRNDGVSRVYGTPGDGHIYEFSWGGSSWIKEDVGSGEEGMFGIAIGNGRNDGVSRVYGANDDDHIYEFSWSGSSWTKVDIGSGSGWCMSGVAVGDGRNDGVSRVYGANDDNHIYEFSFPIAESTEFNATQISTFSIHWTWVDNSTTEDSYYVCTDTYGRISSDLGINSSSWTETGLSPNTQYFRCAEVYNNAGNLYSNIISSYTLANIPSNLIISSRTASSITIDWSGNGTRYAIEWSSDCSNWVYIKQWVDIILGTIYTDSPLNAHTTYWYRVCAYNGDKVITNPCTEASTTTLNSQPQTPINSSPFSGQYLPRTDVNPTFQWLEFNDADGDSQTTLQVQLCYSTGTYGDPSSKNSGEIALSSNSWTPSNWNLSIGTSYYWKVRVKDESNFSNAWSEYSNETEFYIKDNTQPDRPINSSPSDGDSINNIKPDFLWSEYSDPDGDPQVSIQLQIRISTGDYGVGNSKDSGEVANSTNTWTPPNWDFNTGTRYYWRVRVKDDFEIWSEYSVETNFYISSDIYPPNTEYEKVFITDENLTIKILVPDTTFNTWNQIKIECIDDNHIKYSLVEKADNKTNNIGITKAYEFIAKDGQSNLLDEKDFKDNVVIEFTYPTSINLAQENLIAIFRLNETDKEWEELSDCTVDPENNTISTEVSHFSIFKLMAKTATNLKDVIVYPNPFKAKEAVDNCIKFINLPSDVTLRIYDVAGDLIYDNYYEDTKSGITWDGKDDDGSNLASGIYIYFLKDDNGNTKQGKISILR